jgi:hypothetical protein
MRGTREPGPPYTPRPRTNASTHAHKTPTLTHNTHASMHACTMHADALWEEVASTSAIDVIKVRCASACCCWLASVRTARAMRASVLGAPRRRVCGPSSRPSTGPSPRSGHRVAACFVRAWWSAPMGSTRPCAKRWARLRAGGRCRPAASATSIPRGTHELSEYPESTLPPGPPASAALVGSRRVTQIDVGS